MSRHLLILVAGVLPCALHAQTDTTARLMGTAKSSFNGRPLAGVMISVPAIRRFVVTDSTGTFSLSGIPIGPQMVRMLYEGRQTEEFEVTFRSGRTQRVNVMLDVEAVDLDPIVVEAKAIRSLSGFYDRKKLYAGFGTFYTREDIDRMRPLRISDVLRRQGIWVRCSLECVPMRMHRGSLCAVPVIVDGMPFRDFDFDDVAVSDVLGVEVYRGGPGYPFGFGQRSVSEGGDRVATTEEEPNVTRAASPFQARGSCGSVHIWTR